MADPKGKVLAGPTGRAPRKRAARKATLIMASAQAEGRRDWIAGLQETFAIAEVTERKALDEVMANRKPDVLIVDLALPGLRRVRGLRSLRRLSPSTKIVALTGTPADREGVIALKAGVRAYCASAIGPEALGKAVTAVQNGEIWAPRKLLRVLIAELVSLIDSRDDARRSPKLDARLESLTKRQRVVADLISRGASNKEVGKRLNISERTVKAHLTEAFRHAGVADRLHLALLLLGHPHPPASVQASD